MVVSKRFPAIRGETLPGSVSQNLTQAGRLSYSPEDCFVVVYGEFSADLEGKGGLVVVRRKFAADLEGKSSLVVVRREAAMNIQDGLFYHSLAP